MRILYIANARIPTEKAHGVHIIHMCEAFAKAGMDVELVIPWRFNSFKEDAYQYYDVEKVFSIRRVPSLDLVQLGKIGFFIQERTFLFSVILYIFFLGKRKIVYVRGERLAKGILSAIPSTPLVLETHIMPRDPSVYKNTFRMARGIVVVTKSYEEDLKRLGVQNVLYVPDAVSLERFVSSPSKLQCREKLHIPSDMRIVGYVGKYRTNDQPKGVEDLIAAFSDLVQDHSDVFLLLVGINTDEINEVEALFAQHGVPAAQYRCIGHVRQVDVPTYLKACDVLVMNYPALGHYVHYMSPLKLFEYMASGVPIVSTDLPSIRDILNESNALLIPPDSRSALAKGVLTLLNDTARATVLAEQALRDVQQYTWDKRAEHILKFIK